MKIGMTLPVMEPDLSRQDLEDWTLRVDAGPWSHIALGERILFPNPEFISTLSAVAAWTKRVEIIATISVLTMHNPILSAKQFATIDMISEGRFTLGVGLGAEKKTTMLLVLHGLIEGGLHFLIVLKPCNQFGQRNIILV